MKQKVVLKLSLHDERTRTKAMKTAVGVDGVNSAALQQEKDQIEVTGEDVDVVRLTTLLRKNLKFAEVVSVNPVEEEKKEEQKQPEASMQYPYVVGCPPPYIAYPPYYQDSPSVCSIM